MKEFLKFLLLPFGIYLVTKYIQDGAFLHPAFNDPLSAINEFAKYACMIFLAVYIISETAGSYIFPHLEKILKEHILPTLNERLGLFSNNLLEAFKQKDFNIKPSIYINSVEETFMQMQTTAESEDENLKKAEQLLLEGKDEEAISLVEEIDPKSKEHFDFLISRYITTDNKNYWAKAHKYLAEHGELKHFIRFSFTLWENGDLNGAISVSEQGLQLIEVSQNINDSGKVSCMNSLAYYYADGEVSSKSALAYQLTDDVLEILNQAGDNQSIDFANALDTRGYIKISFGDSAEEITSGIDDCKKANSLGLDSFLFHRHLARAHDRLARAHDRLAGIRD